MCSRAFVNSKTRYRSWPTSKGAASIVFVSSTHGPGKCRWMRLASADNRYRSTFRFDRFYSNSMAVRASLRSVSHRYLPVISGYFYWKGRNETRGEQSSTIDFSFVWWCFDNVYVLFLYIVKRMGFNSSPLLNFQFKYFNERVIRDYYY